MPRKEPEAAVVPATHEVAEPMQYLPVPPTDEDDNPIPEGVDLSQGYDGLLKADLHALIEGRNDGRTEADLIVPVSDKNDDLIAALEADDANTSEEN